MKLYFLFSSITFLQYYIPLVIEANKHNVDCVFIFRKNSRAYANPYDKVNHKIIKKYLDEYNIKRLDIEKCKIQKIKGTVIMIDGDIYGSSEKSIKESLLWKLDKKNTTKISLPENVNFKFVYDKFIDYVDYCIFSNPIVYNEYLIHNKISSKKKNEEKHLYLGNTKYDIISKLDDIYSKYNLFKGSKYCLILLPKADHMTKKDMKSLLKIYDYLHEMNMKIIVKNRPKNEQINDKNCVEKKNFIKYEPLLKGDHYICSDIYPNESLELISISELSIITSSSANEECLYAGIPCIDLEVDLRPQERNNYLLNNNIFTRIPKKVWHSMNNNDFKNTIETLKPKGDIIYTELKKDFLYTHKNSSRKIMDFILINNFI